VTRNGGTAERRNGGSVPVRVLAWPGWRARRKNPYTWLLCSSLADLGVRIRDFTPLRALAGGYDVLHVHWPEKTLNARSLVGRLAGAAAAISLLAAARLRGARVVWTAHNAQPHESRHPRLEAWFWKQVIRRVDAVSHPTHTSREAVEARFPALRRLPHDVISLGHMRGAYPDEVSPADARLALGLPADACVITYLGLIRAYKNVPHLIRTIRALPADIGDVVLLVAGEPQTQDLADEIRHAAGNDPRVRLALAHVPESEVQYYLRAADLVALPFTDITNSGSALLALSFDRPVLVPRLGAMGEL
jgi:beta-1,4-mannosyltransferase